ncbi:MAG: CPXCG motif-containing cysteine-rich protein [Bdellovibrionales bacterium]
MVEYGFACPHCRERISIVVDTSVEEVQSYIEDCEVCCNPIEITSRAENGEVVLFEARSSK